MQCRVSGTLAEALAIAARLSAEHSFLHEPCERKEYGNGKKKQDCQTAAFLKNHDEDSDHGAAVGKHAGNSIREELLDGVGISDEAG